MAAEGESSKLMTPDSWSQVTQKTQARVKKVKKVSGKLFGEGGGGREVQTLKREGEKGTGKRLKLREDEGKKSDWVGGKATRHSNEPW